MAMSSCGYLWRAGLWRVVIAMMNVMGPTRPRNITAATRIFPKSERFGVTSRERPVVPKAEVISKRAGRSASRSEIISVRVPAVIRTVERARTASAFATSARGSSRQKSVILSCPLTWEATRRKTRATVVTFTPPPVEVNEHGEPEPPERYDDRKGGHYHPVAGVGYEPVARKDREPRVAEGHDGVEEALEGALAGAHAAAKEARAEHRGPYELHRERDGRYLAEQAQRVAQRVHVLHLLAHREQAPEADPLAYEQGGDGGDRHDPKSPELHQDHHHHLAERGEGGRYGDRREPRDAPAAHRDEEGVDPGDAVLRRGRQLQQHGPERHQRHETVDYEPWRGQPPGQRLLPPLPEPGQYTRAASGGIIPEKRYNRGRGKDGTGEEVFDAANGQLRAQDGLPAHLRHRPVQLPLPVLHAGGHQVPG